MVPSFHPAPGLDPCDYGAAPSVHLGPGARVDRLQAIAGALRREQRESVALVATPRRVAHTPAAHSHSTVTAQSQHSHSTVTAPSQHRSPRHHRSHTHLPATQLPALLQPVAFTQRNGGVGGGLGGGLGGGIGPLSATRRGWRYGRT